MTFYDRMVVVLLAVGLIVGFGATVQTNSEQADRIEHLESSLRACQQLSQQHVRDEVQMQQQARLCDEMVDSLLGVAQDCFSSQGEP